MSTKSCSLCNNKITHPGSVVLSPPIKANKENSVTTVQKYHVCINCWPRLEKAMNHLSEELIK